MESLSRLFGSPARLKVLRLFVFNQDNSFSPADVMRRTKLSRGAVRGELAELYAAGLLRRRGSGRGLRFQTNPRFEHLSALTDFVRDSTSVRPERLIQTLRRAGTPRVIALSGFFTGVPEPLIDLLVVGDNMSERALERAVSTVESELGREIRYAYFPTSDFRYRLSVYDRLIRDVFDYPHRLLLDKIGL